MTINHVQKLRDFLLDLLFPAFCLSCQEEGSYLCNTCKKKIILNKKLFCIECKKIQEFGSFCGACQQNYHFNGMWISGQYHDKLLSKMIKKYKYGFASSLSYPLSILLAETLSELIMETEKEKAPDVFDFRNTIIIPIPLHKKRKNWRGFNQAELLAEKLAAKFSLEINIQDLKRRKNTRPQTGFSRLERVKNLDNAFVWQGKMLNNKNIILVDDVVTTGSTINECAKVLKSAGAGEIWGLAIAQN